MTKDIKAVIIRQDGCLPEEGNWAEVLKALDIRNVTVQPALGRTEIRISNDRTKVYVNGSGFEYGLFQGACYMKKSWLTKGAIGRLLSNYNAWDRLDETGYTIFFPDDVVMTADVEEKWACCVRNLPDEKDYDIILLAGGAWNCVGPGRNFSYPYPGKQDYNEDFYYVSGPNFAIAGLCAYIIHPRIIKDLKSRMFCKLELEDYFSYCINEFKWRVMAPAEILFRQGLVGQGLPRDFKPRKVLFYNRMYNMEDDLSNIPKREGFALTRDPGLLNEADVVLFHMPGMSREDKILHKKYKRDGQLWVFWSEECNAYRSWQDRRRVRRLFDIHATYQMGSDMPLPYLWNVCYDWLRWEPGTKNGFSNVFISNGGDKSGRFKYVKELMFWMEVHSYGKVLNNRKLGEDQGVFSKVYKIADYKFSLAFENAIATDYVTEKFYQPLIVGSVPVYLGAPNIEDFAPGDHCFINVKDFSSPRALAKYLKELDADDARYAEYLQWKKRPFRDSFNSKLNMVMRQEFERLYDLLEERLGM